MCQLCETVIQASIPIVASGSLIVIGKIKRRIRKKKDR
jgi:hypothetical protein